MPDVEPFSTSEKLETGSEDDEPTKPVLRKNAAHRFSSVRTAWGQSSPTGTFGIKIKSRETQDKQHRVRLSLLEQVPAWKQVEGDI